MSVKVSVADLSLSSPVGAKIVLRRIHTAAETICGGEPDIRLAERFALYQSCVKKHRRQNGRLARQPDRDGAERWPAGAITVADRH